MDRITQIKTLLQMLQNAQDVCSCLAKSDNNECWLNMISDISEMKQQICDSNKTKIVTDLSVLIMLEKKPTIQIGDAHDDMA